MIVVFLGAPGSGKGTQAKLISQSMNYVHLSTGDLLRQAIAAKTPMGQIVAPILAAGKFVDDQIVLDLVKEALEANAGAPGVVFDGYPRSYTQADALDELLKSMNLSVDCVIDLQVPDHIIVDRLGGRFSCKECGAPYHDSTPPKVENTCDFCGAHAFVRRADDNPGTVSERLKKYHMESDPLLEFYQAKGIVVSVDGCQNVTMIQSKIRSTLEVSPKEAKYS